MFGFSDLNLNVTNLNDKAIDQLVETAIKLGYDNLGLARDYEFPKKDESESSGKKKKDNRAQIAIPPVSEYKLPKKLETRLESCGRKIKIYSRINIKIKPADINSYLHHLKSKPVQSYDLIALEPTDNQSLMYICTNNFNADIISITSGIECGLTDKHLMRPLKNAVNSFSLTFEVNYSPAISSSTERRDLIMMGRCLAFNTKAKGVIMSSGACQKMNLRSPYELMNMVKLFDIAEKEANRMIRYGPRIPLTNSFCRKHTAAGMVYFNNLSDLKRLENALVLFKRKEIENSQEEANKDTKMTIESNESETEKNKKLKNN